MGCHISIHPVSTVDSHMHAGSTNLFLVGGHIKNSVMHTDHHVTTTSPPRHQISQDDFCFISHGRPWNRHSKQIIIIPVSVPFGVWPIRYTYNSASMPYIPNIYNTWYHAYHACNIMHISIWNLWWIIQNSQLFINCSHIIRPIGFLSVCYSQPQIIVCYHTN